MTNIKDEYFDRHLECPYPNAGQNIQQMCPQKFYSYDDKDWTYQFNLDNKEIDTLKGLIPFISFAIQPAMVKISNCLRRFYKLARPP